MKHYSSLSRRDMLRAGGSAALIGAGTSLSSALPAAAFSAQKSFQAPGFFRFKAGEFEITIVSDGSLTVPATAYGSNQVEAQVKSYLKSNFLDTEKYYAHTNLCLINTGKKLVMVDSGSGAGFQDSAGKVISNLKLAGYEPGDVDAIVITHGHPDHIWGIMDDAVGKPRFPNAQYFIKGTEWDYWTDEALASKLPKSMVPSALGARRNLLPVSAKTKRVKSQEEVVAGVSVIDTPGHTIGHLSVMVASGKETVLISGDVFLHSFISFEHPNWHFMYDGDPELAAETRKKLLDMTASDQILTVGYHLPFPGVGYVARRGQAYRWMPQSWQW